jgi:serine phosphatase RsbU (regulator of sigma subunit)/Tfp pilus assembly protein PilF
VDKLKSDLSLAKNDTAKVNILLSLSAKLYSTSPLEAMQYSSEAKLLASQLKYRSGEAYAYKYIGLISFFEGTYVEAVRNWEEALSIFEEIDEKEGMANMLSNLGVVYNNRGNDARALGLYLRSLKLAEDINDTTRIITAYNNIGLLYSKQSATEKLAQDNYLHALDLSETIQYNDGIGTSALNLGEFYYNQGNYSSALEYFEKSLAAYRITNTVFITNALTYIGNIYAILEDFPAAIKYQEESYNIADKMGARLEMAKACLGLAETYFKSGNNKKALIYSKEAETIAATIGARYEKLSALKVIARTYAGNSEFENAYKYMNQAMILKDTIFSEKNQEQIINLRIQHEIEDMLKENDILKKDIEIREARSNTQKIIIFFLILGFVVTSIQVAMLIRANKLKRKANTALVEKNNLISDQKKEITDSIQYAKKIQSAMLPPHEDISAVFPEHFILFSPRDIVSGDFYWFTQNDDRVVCIIADCTGHGVPGAFMSMLGIAYLNEINSKNPDISAGALLDELRLNVIQSLHQTGRMGENQDGMDITAIIIDNKRQSLQFAGANNPLLLFRKGELIEFKPDKMPIGIHGNLMNPFKNHKIDIEKGDVLYAFSDGFADQFGGPFGKKFMIKKFKETLKELHVKPMSIQKQELEETLENWMVHTRQVDDILVMGIKM